MSKQWTKLIVCVILSYTYNDNKNNMKHISIVLPNHTDQNLSIELQCNTT